MVTDNAAARLLALLLKAQTFNPDASAKQAWMQLFDLKGDDLNAASTMMSKLGQVMILPHQVRIQVEQFFPSQASSLGHAMTQIQNAFVSQNLNGNWHSFMAHIDLHSINALNMASALLETKLESKLIDIEVLSEFRNQVQTLNDEVIQGVLPAEFKKFMSHYLRRIIDAIGDYFISGAMPILDAVEATLGHAVLDPNFRGELTGSETGQKISKVLSDLANTAAVATAAAGVVTYIASNGFPLLG